MGLGRGQAHLLQSRPVTSLFPLPDEAYAADTAASPVLVEAFQGMLGPIHAAGQDAIRLVLVAFLPAFGYRYNLENQRELVVAGERVYINITPVVRDPTFRRLLIGVLGFVEPGAAADHARPADDPQRRRPDSLGFRKVRVCCVFLPLLRVVAGALSA